MPASTFRHSSFAAAPPETVWRELQEPGTWLRLGLMETVTDATTRDGSLTGFRWTARVGSTRHDGRATTTETTPPHRMTIALDARELGAEIVVDLAPAASGTTITVAVTAHPRGLVAGMFWGAIAAALERGLAGHVDEFAAGF